jgi:hypothetical protein
MNIVRSQAAERNDVLPRKTFSCNNSRYPVWEVSFAPGIIWGYWFLALGLNEQEAIDGVIDYCSDKYPGLLLDDGSIEELRTDSINDGYDENTYLNEESTQGGNSGLYLNTPYGITVKRILY